MFFLIKDSFGGVQICGKWGDGYESDPTGMAANPSADVQVDGPLRVSQQ